MTKNIVVVGAGVGGLVCANVIAKERPDYNVILVEAHDKVGGLAQAWDLTHKLTDGRKVQITYELTHAISEMHQGGTFHQLYSDLGVDWKKLGKFEPAPCFAQYITPNNEPLVVFNTLEENFSHLLNQYPQDEQAIKKYFHYLERLDRQREYPSGHKRSLEQKVSLAIDGLPQPLKFPLQVLLYGYTKPTFVNHRNDTFERLMKNFTQEDIKTTLAMLYGYVGLPPSRCSGNLHSLMLLSYWRGGGPQAPMMTSFQTMHDELARTLQENYGGEVRLNSAVTGVTVKKGKVKGVEVNPKGRHRQRYSLEAECIIFAGDPKKMLSELVGEHLPKKYVQKIDDYEMSMSLMATHVVTDLPLHEMKDRLGYAANILASSPQAIELENADNFPEHYVLYGNIPTVLRPEAGLIRDLKGNPIKDLHLIDLVMRSPPHETCKTLRDEDKRGEYNEYKEIYMDQMIEIADELLIPGLKDHCLCRSMYTAATYDRYCDPTEGAVYSIAPTIAGFVPNRPSPNVPLKGAFLTGSAILAGGVGGATSGALETARHVLKYLAKKDRKVVGIIR